jgi:uncharacterized protein
MSDDDYKIEYSSLCQNFSEGSVTVQVQIYRGEDDPGWILEVVDQEGNSTVWDDRFATDGDALIRFIKTVTAEGLSGALQPHPSSSFH